MQLTLFSAEERFSGSKKGHWQPTAKEKEEETLHSVISALGVVYVMVMAVQLQGFVAYRRAAVTVKEAGEDYGYSCAQGSESERIAA